MFANLKITAKIRPWFILFIMMCLTNQIIAQSNHSEKPWQDLILEAQQKSKPIVLIATNYKNTFYQQLDVEGIELLQKNCIAYNYEKDTNLRLLLKEEIYTNSDLIACLYDSQRQQVVMNLSKLTLQKYVTNQWLFLAFSEYQQTKNKRFIDMKQMFEKGNRDSLFLKTLIERCYELSINNDIYIDSYISHIISIESNILFFLKYTMTLDNKAVTYIKQNKDLVNLQMQALANNDIEIWLANLNKGTLNKAIEYKNDKLLEKIKQNLEITNPTQAQSSYYWYCQQYYAAIEDRQGLWRSIETSSDYLCTISDEEMNIKNANGLDEIKREYRQQYLAYGLTEEQIDVQIKESIRQQPMLGRSVSVITAQDLSNACQYVLIEKADDTFALKKALKWSARALLLVKKEPHLWVSFSAVYARLLYRNNQKENALKVMQTAIQKAEEQQLEELQTLIDDFVKMQQEVF